MSDFHAAPPVAAEPPAPELATHGQAALLLVESLMHTLISDGVMAPAAAAETARCAAEVRREIIDQNHDDTIPAPPDLAATLLDRIAATFAMDAPRPTR